MKYAIIGATFSGNKGASAMLESSIQHITELDPEARFLVLTVYPGPDTVLNDYPNVHVMDASPLHLGTAINAGSLLAGLLPGSRPAVAHHAPEVEAIAGADVLLDEGGITFVDGRGKFLIYNVATLLPALFTRTPIVKIAQAMGPFEEPLNGLAARALLPRVSTIVSRGAITREHLDDLELDNVIDGADLAFTLRVSPDAEAEATRIAGTFFDGGDVVGVSPSQVLRKQAEAEGRDYVGEVVAQVDFLTEQMDRPVLLVPHSARSGTDKTHNNDLPVTREIHSRLARPDRVLFLEEELGAQTLRALIGRCDLFVASRFHAMVSSLATAVPTLVIGWSHKYREVLDMFDAAEWAVGYDDMTQAVFEERMRRLATESETIRARLSAAYPAVEALAHKQVEVVVETARRGR